jgi:hypothetical protein
MLTGQAGPHLCSECKNLVESETEWLDDNVLPQLEMEKAFVR